MFDLIVVTIIGLSALLSFFRGFVREIVSLGAWIGASFITIYFMHPAGELVKPHVKSEELANGIASVGVFVVALITISIVAGLLLKMAKIGTRIGLFDNLVGLCFGVARGLLIISIAYFVMGIVIVEKDYPDFVAKAKTRPYIEKSAKWVGKQFPAALDELTDKVKNTPPSDDLGEAVKNSVKALNDTVSHTVDKTTEGEGIPDPAMPSMKDLQQRIREENERN